MGFHLSECRLNQNSFCRRIQEGLTAQWEGLATDATGRLWALQETTESVHVFSPDMSRRVATIVLADSSTQAPSTLAKPKVRDERELFEGIVVLSSRAFLAAKQTKPASIIRYELAEDPANGHQKQQLTATATRSWILPAQYRS
jgi:uncharacterized protein YjiK